MSFFPILENKTLPELIGIFRSAPDDHAIDSDEADLFFQETGIEIARRGKEGATFLLNALDHADPLRLQGILAGLAFVDKEANKDLLPRIKAALVPFFSSDNPDLIAQAVDAANGLGLVDLADSIRCLLGHESPFVVGSVLRFLSAHFPADAKRHLLKALRSPQPIVRQNAIDELDEMECKEALPCIAGLLDDPDKNVRDAAHWAVAHLESANEGSALRNGCLS